MLRFDVAARWQPLGDAVFDGHKRLKARIGEQWPPILAWVLAGLPLLALVLWVVSLPAIRVDHITDYGLITQFPLIFFLCVSLLSIGYSLSLHFHSDRPLVLLAYVLVLLIVIEATTATLYKWPRYNWTYKHFAVIDYIHLNGAVDPKISIYHNWPGFFALGALFETWAGLKFSAWYAGWVPLFLDLAYLPPLLLIQRRLLGPGALSWLGVWVFYISNWIGQNYFSPQGLAFLLYLICIAITLTGLGPAQRPDAVRVRKWARLGWLSRLVEAAVGRAEWSAEATTRGRQLLCLLAVMLGGASIVASHQLTPLFLILALSALVVAQRCRARTLPILVAVMTACWIVFAAETYSQGALPSMIEGLGNVLAHVRGGTGAVQGVSAGRRTVALTSRALTFSVWLLAATAVWRDWRRRVFNLDAILLAAMPFVMVIQSYGAEMLYRLYMFTLPGMSALAASAVWLVRRRPVWLRCLVTGFVTTCLLVLFLVSYFGNERMNVLTTGELAATNALLEQAPEGSLVLVAITGSATTLRTPNEQTLYFDSLQRLWKSALVDTNIDAVAQLLDDRRYPMVYLVITRNQREQADLMRPVAPGTVEKLEAALTASPLFHTYVSDEDTRYWVLAERDPLR